MVDAQDLKSCGSQIPCRFKSGLRHHLMEKYPSLVEGTGLENREAGDGAGVRIPLSPPFNLLYNIAGWSSLVARWAHNPKVVGSNPAPATIWSRGVAVITSACHAEDREFDSRRDRHFFWLHSSVGRAED